MFWRFKQFFPDKFWHIHCYFSFFESSILHFSSSLSRFKGAEKRSVLLITPFKCALFVFLFTKKCKKNDIYYCPKSYNAIPANSVHPPRWPITKGSVPGHKKCSGPHNLYIFICSIQLVFVCCFCFFHLILPVIPSISFEAWHVVKGWELSDGVNLLLQEKISSKWLMEQGMTTRNNEM